MWPMPKKVLRRYRRQTRERKRQVRYGVGMGLGLLAVHFTKKLVRAVPGLGHIASPILNLFPTVVVGPLLGAGVVLVLDEGDIPTATEKVRDVIRKTGNEVEAVAKDLHDDLQQVVRRHELNTGRPLLPTSVHPTVAREMRRMDEQLDRLRRETNFQQKLQQAAAGARR